MSYGHGGYRAGSGRPSMSKEKKALEGKLKEEKINAGIPVLEEVKDAIGIDDINEVSDITDVEEKDMPKIEEYLKSKERSGKPLGADYEYKKMWLWLKKVNCEKIVNPKLIEMYAINAARTKQCHEMLSSLGLVVKNASGNPIASPFADMALNFEKGMNNALLTINQIVKENGHLTRLNYDETALKMESILFGSNKTNGIHYK
ncbi:MAG: hypothetical protein J6M39_03435 [Lachnospiraceae bacterium]|nr:hypothetical protein [Lachnospiraceae bacterium]